jgi:hypothetical protein
MGVEGDEIVGGVKGVRVSVLTSEHLDIFLPLHNRSVP